MVVLIGAGLLLRTLDKLKSINPGFDTRNILLFSVDPTLAGYKEENIQNVYDEMERRLVALPGVVSASYSSDALLDGGLWSSDVHLRGQAEKSRVDVQMLAVGPDFFETMRIPLLQGRTFRATDARSTQMVAVVNQALARKFPESRDPFGLALMWSDHQMEIVGVVADTKYDRLQKEDEPTLYIPLKSGEVTFALRTVPAPANLIPAVRHIVNEVDENLPVFGVRTNRRRSIACFSTSASSRVFLPCSDFWRLCSPALGFTDCCLMRWRGVRARLEFARRWARNRAMS